MKNGSYYKDSKDNMEHKTALVSQYIVTKERRFYGTWERFTVVSTCFISCTLFLNIHLLSFTKRFPLQINYI